MNVDVLLSRDQIAVRVNELGREIRARFGADEPLVLIGVLRGSFVFLADLVRAIPGPVECEFLAVQSYQGTQPSGTPEYTLELQTSLRGRAVVVVEDIVDTGNTLSFLLGQLRDHGPASLAVACLLDKPSRRVTPVHVDWVGFTIEDHFVVGYGLDHRGRYRNLPFVGVLDLS